MKPSLPNAGASGQNIHPVIGYDVTLPFTEFDEMYRSDAVQRACRACKNHRNNWSCPPFDPRDVDRVRSAYDSIEVICHRTLLKCPADLLSDRAAVERFKLDALRATRSTMADHLLRAEHAHPGSQALFPGSCALCGPEDCARRRKLPCVHPSIVRPSLEAFGYDLEKLVKNLFDLEFYWTSEGKVPPYYLLVGALLLPPAPTR